MKSHSKVAGAFFAAAMSLCRHYVPWLGAGLILLFGGVRQASAEQFLMSTDGQSSRNISKASALGHAVTSSTLAGIVASTPSYLNGFDVVWVNPSLNSSGYSTLQTGVAGGGSLEQYVSAGGTLVINVAGNSGSQSDIAPGGADYNRSITHNYATFTSPSHQYLTGSGYGGHVLSVSDFDNWSSTDHGWLFGLAAGTTTVLSNADGPSFVEYAWGNGTVLLNTLTYGWGSSGARGNPQDNLINYAASRLAGGFDVSPYGPLNSSGPVGGPFAPTTGNYILTNNGPNSLDWSVAVTQSWVTVAPGGGTLAPGGSDTVVVSINSAANFLGQGAHTDTVTFSDLTNGIDQLRAVNLFVGTVASIPFVEDFEGGPALAPWWESTGTSSYRTRVTSSYNPHGGAHHLTMDSSSSNSYACNELTLTINLDNHENVALTFWAKMFDDEYDGPAPVPFTGGYDFDGIAVSEDGHSWYEVFPLSGLTNNYAQFNVDLDAAIASHGLSYNSAFRIRFNHYDNYEITTDGFAFDDIEITGSVIDTLIISPSTPCAWLGVVGGPFSPGSHTYVLTNSDANALDWTVSKTQPWLDVAPGSGTLLPGDSNAVVVALNSQADLLAPGLYYDTITFTNVTTGVSQTRHAELTVTEPPPELVVTLNQVLCPRVLQPDEVRVVSGAITLTNLPGAGTLTWAVREASDPNAASSTVIATTHTQPGVRSEVEESAMKEQEPVEGLDGVIVDGKGGPDPAGYTYIDSKEPGGPTFDWIDIRNTGTNMNLSDDSYYYPINLPFAFDFYGTSYTSAAVCSNGTIYFEDRYLTYGNICITGSTGVNRFIALYWDDLYPSGTNNVYFEIVGSAPNRIFIVQFENVSHYGNSSDRVTAQAQLFEQSNKILLLYEDPSNEAGSGATVGIQGDASTGLEYICNSAALEPSLAILFSRGISWVEVFPTNGTLAAGQSVDLDVTFDATGLADFFTDEGLLVIDSNDPNSPVEIDVCLEVVPDPLEIIPEETVEFSGHPGGPFVPTSASYQLTNTGPNDIDWSLAASVVWLDISPTDGTLPPGGSTTVTVSPNVTAQDMNEGYHYEELTFMDITTGVDQVRGVALNVYTESKIWTSPQSLNVVVCQGQTHIETLTIGNGGDSVLEYFLTGRQTSFTPADSAASAPGTLTVAESSSSSSVPEGYDFTEPEDGNYAPGQLLVRFAPADANSPPGTAEKAAIIQEVASGSTIEKEYTIVPGLCLVELPPTMTVKEALIEFNNREDVLYAQPDYELYESATFPDDPRFGELWGMHNAGQGGGTADADIDAPEAWDIATGTDAVIVAVIDTGVDYTHPELAANMWVNQAEFAGVAGVDDDGNGYIDDIYGYDFRNNDGDPWDDRYHGTHVAGTIGAIGNNGQGVAGVCWNVRIMALKFLSSGGSGNTSDAVESLEYSTAMGADLSNNSWGGGSYNQALRDAIEAAGDAGMLFVASAGNDYGNNNDISPHYPSSYDSASIIAVLATNCYDNIANFSSFGPTSVDIGAPGEDVLSCEPGNGYRYLNGTSMAAPHVSGAAALMWSLCPSLSNLEVKDIMLETADPVPALAGMCVSSGRLNLYNAISELGGWVEFVPDRGSIPPGDINQVAVVFNGDQPPGTYEGEIIIDSNDPFASKLVIPVTLTVETAGEFAQMFDPNGNDLSYRTLTFIPDGACRHYSLCSNEALTFPVDPLGGADVPLGDDDYIPVMLDSSVHFYGTEYDTFYIGSNGYISFVSGDIGRYENFEDHFAFPRISALFDDLDPSSGGSVSCRQLDDRVVVTFEEVPEYGMWNSNSFQIEIRRSGKVRITLLETAAQDGLVGLSKGEGLSPYFVESDLSLYDLCAFPGDVSGDQEVDLVDFGIFATYWQQKYLGNLMTVRDEFNDVSYAGNAGSENWSTSWEELGESDGPARGILRVLGDGRMRIGAMYRRDLPSLSLSRGADLSMGATAVLSFDYATQNNRDTGVVSVEVSGDGGLNWHTLANYNYSSAGGSARFDITEYISPATQIRFSTGSEIAMYLYVDNVQIEFDDSEYLWHPWSNGCDFNQDFIVDICDLRLFVEHWLD